MPLGANDKLNKKLKIENFFWSGLWHRASVGLVLTDLTFFGKPQEFDSNCG